MVDVEMPELSNEDKKPAANKKRSGSSSKAPPSKKRRKVKKVKRRRTEEEKKEYLEEGIADAKEAFEELRDKTLAEIPENYKSMFGQIGFNKYGKVFWPVLVLSPFSISPGPVREQWFDMFEKLKQKDRIEKMSYLIYFYGSDLNDNCFSFIPQRAFTSYENGVKSGYDKLSKNMQKKMDGSGKLTKADSNVIQALEEMREDLKKEPKERRGKLDDVREGYEMLSVSDVDDLTDASEEEERLESVDEVLGDEEFSETEIKQKKQDRRSNKTAKKKAAAKKDESVSNAGESMREDGLLDAIVTEVGEIEDIGDIEASEEDENYEDFIKEEEPIDDKEHDDDWRDERKQKPKGVSRKKKKVSEISHKKESIESEDELFLNENIEETKTERQKRAAQNPFQSDDSECKDDSKEAQLDDNMRRILTRWNAQNPSQTDDDASKDENEEAKQDDVVRRIDALENKMHLMQASVDEMLTLLKGDKSESS